jgi:hypothetical protein
MSEYPKLIPEDLPHRVVHVSTTVEYCCQCFLSKDPRQPSLFPLAATRRLPLPFLGERSWEAPAKTPAPRSGKPPVKRATLEDF